MFFGKSCEYRVMSELLDRSLDVYTPIVDDKGIDCIIRREDGKHIDLQIKGRKPTWIFNIAKFEPRDNYYFALLAKDRKIYIVPSKILAKWLDGKKKITLSQGKRAELEQYKEQPDYALEELRAILTDCLTAKTAV